ncbi:protein sprouty homolog 2 [Nematostella vectensis]|uniref:protein sprouty homolog 2 n=1 Tax=Nematostella vectensis TaxID=45351 RepID=UPI002076DDE3|nr:protein sprouty homolog 2 [Nematostella vectensis]
MTEPPFKPRSDSLFSMFSTADSAQYLLACPSESRRESATPSVLSNMSSHVSDNLINSHNSDDNEEESAADRCIDYCTCMCCAKALFYHWAHAHEIRHEDDPCYCGRLGIDCAQRWAVLSLLSCCMPGLLMYAPLKGLQKANDGIKGLISRHFT